tara:strand:- start:1699 stop:2061 length:363 start_codon:yes stop_codon:yes gene_type:complete
MTANSETILSIQTHPGDDTTQTVTGEKYKGDGFYSRSDGFHTVQYTVTALVGTVKIQATLATDPTSTDWFDVSGTTHTSIAIDTDNSDGSFLYNFTGNYVWVRAVLTYTAGTINSILLNH